MRFTTLFFLLPLACCRADAGSESGTSVLHSPVDDVVYQVSGAKYVFFERIATDTPTREVRIVDVVSGLVQEKMVAFLNRTETELAPVEFTISTTSGIHLAKGLLKGSFDDKQATIDDTLADACSTTNPFDLYLEQITTGAKKTYRGEFRKDYCVHKPKYAGEK